MIGIFDSGSGGLTFLAAMRRRYPEFSYLYLGDFENCPYGDKTPEQIQDFTTAGVLRLFDAGATIVILACNTASAWTLRHLQSRYPDRRILGVTIPGAEKVVELGLHSVTVFATAQTVQSRTYKERMRILDDTISVDEVALSGDLVRDIEALLPIQRCHTEEEFNHLTSSYGLDWNFGESEWRSLATKYFSLYEPQKGIILGCTHYSYLKKPLSLLFPENIIVDPSEESADKFSHYLSAHPDAFFSLKKTGKVVFL